MILINNQHIQINHFPDNTLLLKNIEKSNTIRWHFENNEEFVALQFIVFHLRDLGVKDIVLEMPYIPNARQDRVKSDEDVFTLKHFATILNSLEFSKVRVLDAHSPVSLDLINNVEEIPVAPFIKNAIKYSGLDYNKDIIFFPDEGAKNRYSGMIDFPHAFGIKSRNWENGQIESLEVSGEIPNKPFNVLIVDDICSYGGTFKRAAEKLKELGAEEIFLYVSHCEKNIQKGDLLDKDLVEAVFTTESIYNSSWEDSDYRILTEKIK